ncbi:hypothetical protein [Streptomyces chrestomyceticus]|uniref:hypothetical protein n=1 Tax=Streptomyces chrestomyceticus TaxID=68185 RepID=UPI00379CECDC
MGVMVNYRVYLYNVMTQDVYAEIPFSSLTYRYVMDDAGSATVEIPIGVPKVGGQPLAPADIFPARTGLVIQRGEDLVWGGIVWTYRLNLTSRTITLSALGYQSYYRYRVTGAAGSRFKNTEQTDMIKGLISILRDGIKTDTSQLTGTNMVRTREWNPYEFKPLSDIFADLSDDITAIDPRTGKLGGGFFFYFEPYWITPGAKIGNRVINTPNRHPYDSGKSLQQGVNCEFPDISVDGTSLATTCFAVGATDGTKSLTPYARDENTPLLKRIPHLSVVLNETGIKQSSALQYKVRSALAFGANPVTLPTAETYPGLFSPLELKPGMRAGVTTDDGFLNLVNEDYAITETTVTVATDGNDRLALSFVQTALFKETENG